MRTIYILPNLITSLNLLCGFLSIVFTFQGDYREAAWAIVLAGVFDLFDGRIARLAKATSSFGVEFDSLSDLMSFGVAPAVLVYVSSLEPFGRLGIIASFLFLLCGALRLARFNVTSSTLKTKDFQGLPIPMAAGLLATFFIFSDTVELDSYQSYFVLGSCFALAFLMVSTIPFPSFKELNWRSRSGFGVFFGFAVSLVAIALRPDLFLFGTLAIYLFLSLVFAGYRKIKPKKTTLHEPKTTLAGAN